MVNVEKIKASQFIIHHSSFIIQKWGWWDSNLLSGKAPDLQSGPALQLRGTPLVRVKDNRQYVHTLGLVPIPFTSFTYYEPLEGLEPPTS